MRGAAGLIARFAGGLSRAFLLLYPSAFRREDGAAMVRDARRRAAAVVDARGGVHGAMWLIRHAASLALNAVGAWSDALGRHGGGSISLLDLKLGARMLLKHRALTLVGVVALTTAIGIGAVFGATAAVYHAALPFDEGDRVVALEMWDGEINNQERRILHDAVEWRDELRSIEEVGWHRRVSRNLIDADGGSDPIVVAEITPAGFGVPRVPPLLGRPLVEGDTRPGAPDVLVIGFDVWRTRFSGDSAVVGTIVRLGETPHTVVGVMPEGFHFPIKESYWAPFRLDPADFERREGPGVWAFGRLAAGATLEGARAELATVGRRTAAAFPGTHEHLGPTVLPYSKQMYDDFEGWEIPFLAVLVVGLLAVISVNVATLIYARTATRESEILVRTALGASRRRIVGQLFAEALVLSGVAALFGLLIAGRILDGLDRFFAPYPFTPFWVDFRLTPGTIVWVLGLTAVGAVLVGVVPALKATGARVQEGLQRTSGGAAVQLGRTWTLLIVAQVAFAVAVLPGSATFGADLLRHGFTEPGFPAEEYLALQFRVNRGVAASSEAEEAEARFERMVPEWLGEVVAHLQGEPAVMAVSASTYLPGGEPHVRVEVEGIEPGPTDDGRGFRVRTSSVEPRFFETFDLAVVEGRGFGATDLAPDSRSVIVSDAFVRDVLRGGNAVGRRIRYTAGYRAGGVERTPYGVDPESWYEIVGVTDDLLDTPLEPGEALARVYHGMELGSVYPVTLSMRVRGRSPAELIPRARSLAASVDASISFANAEPLDVRLGSTRSALHMGALGLGSLTLAVVLLSLAGLYSLMSFTVVQRWREIGIRTALGAHPRRLLLGIFSRALAQVGCGVVLGLAFAAFVDHGTGGQLTGGRTVPMLLGTAGLMLLAGVLAAVGPARRGLAIEPTVVLKAE